MATGASNKPAKKAVSKNGKPASGTNNRRNSSGKSGIPDRYSIKETDDLRSLTCFESPNITVQIERGQVTGAGQARKSAPGTIYLDGAAAGAPFLEHEKLVYNLDHHEGCIRTFTLSTCEQALVMLMKGLDLRKQEWRIMANDPDLDTVLGIWVLLNNNRLREKNTRIRRTVIPLVRLEGVIDAHGLDFLEFCGYPEDLLNKSMKTIENLRNEELRIKREGRWDEIDFLEYTAETLRKIDTLVYRGTEFSTFQEIEELGQVNIYQNKLAVACRSDAGIYETEQQLKEIYGARLALLLLQKDPQTYTIRQTDLFLPSNLELIYERLNILDPAVTGRRPENRWGGSTDIGGSPRNGGTRLLPREIIDACFEVFHNPGMIFYAKQALKTVLWGAGIFIASWFLKYFWTPVQGYLSVSIGLSGNTVSNPGFAFILLGLLFTTAGIFALTYPRSRYRLFGLEIPAGWDWLTLIPAAGLFGILGGAWAPWVDPDFRSTGSVLFHLLFLPLLAELLFRGLLHGTLLPGSRVQHRGSGWFISFPTLVTALLYALTLVVPYSPFLSLTPLFAMGNSLALPAMKLLLGLLFGLSLAIIRERSESLLASYLTHFAASGLVLYTYQFLI